MLGFVDVLLNDFMFGEEDEVYQKELLNCPEWTARIGFKLKIT